MTASESSVRSAMFIRAGESQPGGGIDKIIKDKIMGAEGIARWGISTTDYADVRGWGRSINTADRRRTQSRQCGNARSADSLVCEYENWHKELADKAVRAPCWFGGFLVAVVRAGCRVRLAHLDSATTAIGTTHLCGSARRAKKAPRLGTFPRLCRINAAFLSQPVSFMAVVLTRYARVRPTHGG
jgi:hypothetical protein